MCEDFAQMGSELFGTRVIFDEILPGSSGPEPFMATWSGSCGWVREPWLGQGAMAGTGSHGWDREPWLGQGWVREPWLGQGAVAGTGSCGWVKELWLGQGARAGSGSRGWESERSLGVPPLPRSPAWVR